MVLPKIDKRYVFYKQETFYTEMNAEEIFKISKLCLFTQSFRAWTTYAMNVNYLKVIGRRIRWLGRIEDCGPELGRDGGSLW